jgi:hypothetical protein
VAARKEASGPALPVPVLVVLALGAVGAAAVVGYQRFGPKPAPPPPISAEGKAYTRNLQLADVEMKATASYMGQEVVEITGKITNSGDRVLRQVDLSCVFADVYGNVVRRERVPIVRPKEGPLGPGQTRAFRLPFDSIPQSWNRASPQLVIAQVLFEQP